MRKPVQIHIVSLSDPLPPNAMMNNDILNTLVLGTLLTISVGFGLWVTQKSQPEELARLEQEETGLRLRHAEVTDLLTAEADSEAQADHAIRRWNSRYKVLPQHLSSPAVVAYLNELSRSGFRSFDVSLGGIVNRSNYSVLTYNIRGTGFFESLYDFIWEVENGRGLYRVSDLTLREVTEDEVNPVTNVPRRHQLVQFSMKLDAFFGGNEAISSPDSIITVPDHVLPPRRLDANPFRPLILTQLPPNTDNLVDLETDELISILGNVAVFRTNTGPRQVREGERIYLGRISNVDSRRARVVAELNKGGIRERLEIELGTGEQYRRSMGLGVQFIPLNSPAPERPSPPQPGTPEYLRLFGDGTNAGTGSDTPLREQMRDGQTPTEPSDTTVSERRADSPAVETGRGVAVRPFPSAPQSGTDDN